MPVQAPQPFTSFLQGRQARQQENYANSRNALAQMEVQNAPQEMQRRNRLLDTQIQGAERQLSKDQATTAYTTLKQALDSGSPREFILQNVPLLASKLQEQRIDLRSMDDQQAASLVENLARKYAGEAGIAPEPAPVQFETIQGPGGSILQRNQQTNQLSSVLGRERAPLVSINNRAEGAAERAYGEAEGKAFANVIQRGQDAQDKAQSLRVALNNPAVTGPTQDFRAAAGALFSDLGIPISPDRVNQIANLSQFKGTLNQLVLNEQLKQKGPQTESDAKRIAESFGKATNIQEANKLILNYQVALAERESVLAQMAEEYRQRTGKIDGWRQELREYVRETPLAGYNPKSGRLVFWNEFVNQVREQNPEAAEEDIMNLWREKYADR